MQTKIIILLYLFAGVLNAGSIRTETPAYISYRVNDKSFEEVQLRISNELQINAFNLVFEVNIAKALEAVSTSLEKQSLLQHGVSIGFCKPSLSYQMVDKSVDTLLYCPLKLVIYQSKESSDIVISFLKTPELNDQVDPKNVDVMVEKIISTALD